MAEIKNRSEIEEKYKWDLSVIYKSDKSFNNDIDKVNKLIAIIPSIKDSLIRSGKDLYEGIDKIESISRIIEKLYTYVHLKHDEDISNSKSIELLDKIENLNIKFVQSASFYEPVILSLNYEDIEKMYKEYPKLKEYERYLYKMFRYKKHMLSETEEKLINDLSKAYSDNETVFSSLTDSDIDFGTIKDKDGNEVTLTNTNYSLYVKSEDRRVRHDALYNLYGTYGRYKTSLATLLEGELKKQATFSKLRGFNSSIESSMYHDELTPEVYNAVIESVSNGLEPLFKYYRIKKEILGVDEMHIYDTYADVISKCNKEYTYEDAKNIIKDTLKVFGDDYINNINKAFDERWIDVMPNTGKRGGAYSSGCYDTYPYILTNFQGGFNDVTTLIHELGHSMHSYYSRNNNSYVNSNYSIVVAEVASTVNELLLAYHIINNTKDLEEKLYILDRLMSLFKGTIYRQTMYEEFEKWMYEKVEKEETLTSDVLCDKFYKLNKKYYGKDIVIDDVIKYEWGRMPHLYYNFYMYKYVTGLSSACYIVDSILNNKKDAVKNYLRFLTTGGTLPPNEELKITGVDLTKKEVCDNAIKMFSNIVDEFEKTYNEYKMISGDVNE